MTNPTVHTSEDVARLAGVPVRTIDSWARSVIRPTGIGGWSDDDVAICRVLGRLSRLGAKQTVLAAVAADLGARHRPHWPPRVYVDTTGVLAITGRDLPAGGWVVPTAERALAA